MKRFLTFAVILGFLFAIGCSEKREVAKPLETGKKVTLTKETAEIPTGKQPAETGKTDKVEKSKEVQNTDAPELKPPTLEDVGDPSEVAMIETEKGNIVVEFYPDVAPLHVANFKNLAKAGFFDGTAFHRVLPGFVIQGGDPNTKDDNPHNDGQGGPPYRVKAEFSDRLHVKGILSMARSNDPNSAGSQFFICLGRATHLDKKYTVFGNVIKGIETVEKIGGIRRDPSNKYDRSLPAVVMHHVKIIKRNEIDKFFK